MEFPFVPMEPVPRADAFDDPSWLAQLKWDGVRCLARVANGGVRLFSRSLRERTARYPELAALPAQLRAGEAILDGELISLREGRPSFFAIMQRELAAVPGKQPAVYMVFDLLQLDGRELAGLPLVERQAALAAALQPGGAVQLVESFAGNAASALWQAVAAQALEGIVLKAAASPYVAGARSPHWQKVKLRRRLQAVVAGVSGLAEHPGALLLGLYAGPALRYVGRCGGLRQADLDALRRELSAGPCPLQPPPALGSLPVAWVQPVLTVRVDYAEWTPGLHLRQPVFAGYAGVAPQACVFP